MSNPILEMLNKQNNPTMNVVNTLKGMRSPQGMMNLLSRNNPQLQQVMNYVAQNGNDPKAAFYKKAKEMGVDPEQVLKQLRN